MTVLEINTFFMSTVFNKLTTLMLVKIQVQIRNMGVIGCKYKCYILIINASTSHNVVHHIEGKGCIYGIGLHAIFGLAQE